MPGHLRIDLPTGKYIHDVERVRVKRDKVLVYFKGDKEPYADKVKIDLLANISEPKDVFVIDANAEDDGSLWD